MSNGTYYMGGQQGGKHNKLSTVLAGLAGFVVGLVIGIVLTGVFLYLPSTSNIEVMTHYLVAVSKISSAVEYAKATFVTIDDSVAISYAIKLCGGTMTSKLAEILRERRTSFADALVDAINDAYNELLLLKNKVGSDKAREAIERALSYLENAKSLAVQLKTIAYKDNITPDDDDTAKALTNNIIDNLGKALDELLDALKYI